MKPNDNETGFSWSASNTTRSDLPEISKWNAQLGNAKGIRVSPTRAIRLMCLSCMGGHEEPIILVGPEGEDEIEKQYRPYNDVRDCENTCCWLYPFRFGHDPYRKKSRLSDARKAAMAAGLAKARADRA